MSYNLQETDLSLVECEKKGKLAASGRHEGYESLKFANGSCVSLKTCLMGCVGTQIPRNEKELSYITVQSLYSLFLKHSSNDAPRTPK